MTLRTEELAAQLKPYVIKWMQNMVLQDTIGRHELGGSLHTGQINDSQAPQFLKTDGSRALSGDLAVSEFATIDGVDLDVFLASFDLHTLDPDAHHEPVTIVDTESIDLSLSGQQLSAVVIPGGIDHGAIGGLGDDDHGQYYNAARHTLALHTSLGLVANTREINSGFGLTGGGNLTANRSLSVVASSDVSGVSTETVLKSTAAGGLTLKQLQINGDLTVGTNVLNVDQSVGNIGINCVPDAQFDLDVAGNLRAQGWIVGKHAIQVKDARMICHFDGSKIPGDITFNPTGHMGQIGSISGCVYGSEGKFGKAATFVPTKTNYVTNPSFEGTYVSGIAPGYNTYTQGGATGTRSESADKLFGTKCQRITKTDNLSDVFGVSTAAYDTGTPTTVVSIWFKVLSYTAGATVYLLGYRTSGGRSNSVTYVIQPEDVGVWKRLDVKYTDSTDGLLALYVALREQPADVLFDGAMMTNDFLTPYFDGSFPNAGWSAAANLSSSYSGVGSVSYANALVPLYGTINVWLKVDSYTNAAGSQTVVYHTSTVGALRIYVRQTDGLVVYQWGTGAYGTFYLPVGEWHMVTITKDVTNMCQYVDGVLTHTFASTPFEVHTSNLLNVGGLPGNNAFSLNGAIDELAIIDRALTADEIKAIYESDAPIFAETSNWSWRTSNNLAWADANGLWAVDKNSNSAFGVSGIDGYSWGGFTLDAGDIVLGRNVSGSSAIKWDISAGKFGFYGNGGSTPQVEIDTTGTIVAGGTKMNADGVAALEDTGSFGWDEMDYLRKAYKINDASGATKAALGMQSDQLILRTSPTSGAGHKTINISSDYSYTWTGISWLQKSSYLQIGQNVEIKARGVVNIVGYDPAQVEAGGGLHVYGYGLASVGTPSSGDVFVDGKVKSGSGFSHNANVGLTANVAVAKVGGGTRTLKFSGGIYYGYTDS